MPLQSIEVCAAARFLPHTLALCLRSGRDRHEDLYRIGVLSHGSGKDMFQADSDCSRCQLSSWMSEVFVSLLAVSRGHSQQLNISLQLLHEPFKTRSKEKNTLESYFHLESDLCYRLEQILLLKDSSG